MGSFPDTLIDPSFFVDFCGPCIELKLGKGGQTFLSFNPGASLPSLATKDRKQEQNGNIIFGIQLMGKTFKLF